MKYVSSEVSGFPYAVSKKEGSNNGVGVSNEFILTIRIYDDRNYVTHTCDNYIELEDICIIDRYIYFLHN